MVLANVSLLTLLRNIYMSFTLFSTHSAPIHLIFCVSVCVLNSLYVRQCSQNWEYNSTKQK